MNEVKFLEKLANDIREGKIIRWHELLDLAENLDRIASRVVPRLTPEQISALRHHESNLWLSVYYTDAAQCLKDLLDSIGPARNIHGMGEAQTTIVSDGAEKHVVRTPLRDDYASDSEDMSVLAQRIAALEEKLENHITIPSEWNLEIMSRVKKLEALVSDGKEKSVLKIDYSDTPPAIVVELEYDDEVDWRLTLKNLVESYSSPTDNFYDNIVVARELLKEYGD